MNFVTLIIFFGLPLIYITIHNNQKSSIQMSVWIPGHFQSTDLNNKKMRLTMGALEDRGAKQIRDEHNVYIATREG